MSGYGLRKEQSRIWRIDTCLDLRILNKWLAVKGFDPVVGMGQSVRLLENSVALIVEKHFTDSSFPETIRGTTFYLSILDEIPERDKNRFSKLNKFF